MRVKASRILTYSVILMLVTTAYGCSSASQSTSITTSIIATPTTSDIERNVGSITWTTGVPGDGYYTYSLVSAPGKPNGAIEGRVFLLGNPLNDFPPITEWQNSGYPTLIPGKILVVFGYIERNDPHIYVDSGQTWTYDGWSGWNGSDIYFYSNGYGIWKFEGPSVQPNTLVRLPDVILKPEVTEWVLYPK